MNVFVKNGIIQIQQISSMQHKIQAFTPQKRAGCHSFSNRKAIHHEELQNKELSPFAECYATLQATQTPNKMQLQFLQSPLPTKKDLFLQLLGTEGKGGSPRDYPESSMMEQESCYGFEDMMIRQSEDEEDSESDSQSSGDQIDESGAKKRKRKSTAQIKMLKQELDGQMNWTKQKICKMAEVTGLSQSQVYKWCWDQKKKNTKNGKDAFSRITSRRKIIRKNISFREDRVHGKQDEIQRFEMLTKMKPSNSFEQHQPQTERKINKKLIFS